MSDFRWPTKAIGPRFANRHACNLAAIISELVQLSLNFAEENQSFLPVQGQQKNLMIFKLK
jgi:hypothetical protein